MSQTTTTDPFQPGLPLPPGQTLDLTGPFTLQPYHALTAVACIISTTIAVAARMYTKAVIMKQRTWEDLTCIIGWASFMAFIGIEYSIGNHGGGTHQWNVLYKDVQYSWKYSNYGDIVYSLALLFTKLSILLLIFRVFCSVRRDLGYWCTLSLIWLNSIFYTVYFFIPIFSCTPRLKIWAPDTPGFCMKINILYYASAIFNMISDIVMLTVPIFLIWNLQMSVKRKIGVSAIFMTGALACISSILRLVYISFLTNTSDYTYTKVESVMWSESELCFALLCGCFPVMPRLYQHLTSVAPYTGNAHRSNTYGHNAYVHTANSSVENNKKKSSATGGMGMGMGMARKGGNWKALEEEQGGGGALPLGPLQPSGRGESVPGAGGPELDQQYSRDEVALDKGVHGTDDLEMGGISTWGKN